MVPAGTVAHVDAEPEEAQYILTHTEGVVGFFGASSIERLPTEVAITGCVGRFKAMHFRSGSEGVPH